MSKYVEIVDRDCRSLSPACSLDGDMSPPPVPTEYDPIDAPSSTRVKHLIAMSVEKMGQWTSKPQASTNSIQPGEPDHGNGHPRPALSGARRKKTIWMGMIVLTIIIILIFGVLSNLYASSHGGSSSSSSGANNGPDNEKANYQLSTDNTDYSDNSSYATYFGDNYNETFANRSYLLAIASGCKNRTDVAVWNCRLCRLVGPDFELYEQLNFNYTHGLVGFDHRYNQVVLAFAGMKNSDNRKKSVQIKFHKYYLMNGTHPSGTKIHTGWYKYWQSFGTKVFEALSKVVNDHPHAPILFTGYSMGSTFISMAALDWPIYQEMNGMDSTEYSLVMTFGSPRWANTKLSQYFNKNVGATWRVVNMFDAVPMVPPRILPGGYTHTKNEIWYSCTEDDPNGGISHWHVCAEDDGLFSDCSYPFWLPFLNDHMFYYHVYSACSFYTSKGVRKTVSRVTPCIPPIYFEEPDGYEDPSLETVFDAMWPEYTPSESGGAAPVLEG